MSWRFFANEVEDRCWSLAGRLQVHYLEWGSGDTTVLIHTGPGEARDWERVASRLAGDLRCVAVDLYGRNGTTSWAEVRGPTMDDLADLIQQFIAQLGGPVHVVGHSDGGAVALRLAITSPDSVARLVVIEPQVLGLLREAGDPTAGVGEEVMINLKNLVAAGDADTAWRMMIDTYSGAGFWDRLPTPVRSRFLERTDENSADGNGRLAEASCGTAFRGGPCQATSVTTPRLSLAAHRRPRVGRVRAGKRRPEPGGRQHAVRVEASRFGTSNQRTPTVGESATQVHHDVVARGDDCRLRGQRGADR